MAKPLDITGETFGKLTARERVGKTEYGHMMWRCSCECGGEAVASANNLRGRRVTTCGCGRGKHERPASKRETSPRSTLPRTTVRPWLRLSEAERSILRVNIDKMLIHAAMRQERVTA